MDEGFLGKINGPFYLSSYSHIVPFPAMLADWRLYR